MGLQGRPQLGVALHTLLTYDLQLTTNNYLLPLASQLEIALRDLVAGDAEVLRLLERAHPLHRHLAEQIARRVE